MIQISQNAAIQIHKMLAKNGLEGGGLRIGVKAGGCSGYEYIFAWEREPRAADQVFARVFDEGLKAGLSINVSVKSFSLEK